MDELAEKEILSLEKQLSDLQKQDTSGIAKSSPKVYTRLLYFFFAFVLTLILTLFSYILYKAEQEKYTYVFSSPNPTIVLETQLRESSAFFDTIFTPARITNDDFSSKSIIVYDLTANRSIYAKNPDNKVMIASLTKLASIDVLVKSINLEGETVIFEDAATKEGSALILKSGMKFRNIDLVKAAIIASSNQAVFALQNPNETVDQMNQLAKALETQKTNFANPAGYDDPNNFSTAREIIWFAKLFFSNEALKQFASTSEVSIVELNSNKPIKVSTTVDLIKLRTPNVVAGKTGTTPAAGQNLLLLVNKNGHQYLIVLLNGIDRYKDAYKVLDRL